MDLKKHYQKLYKLHGNKPESVQWSDIKSQERRLDILLDIDKNIESILDVGCGLGDLYNYLLKREFKGKYCGVDFVNEFIESARQKYNNSNAIFFLQDLQSHELPDGYDYVVLSGVFNNKMNNNKEFMLNTINKMFHSCRKGVAFNAMSTYVDFQAENLYYSDPLEIFDYCKKSLTRKVVLRHDYLVKDKSIPFEYAIYLYK